MADDVYSYDSSVARDAEGSLAQTLTTLEKEIYQGIQSQWDKAAGTMKEILGSVKTTLGSTTESVDGMRSQVRSTLQA